MSTLGNRGTRPQRDRPQGIKYGAISDGAVVPNRQVPRDRDPHAWVDMDPAPHGGTEQPKQPPAPPPQRPRAEREKGCGESPTNAPDPFPACPLLSRPIRRDVDCRCFSQSATLPEDAPPAERRRRLSACSARCRPSRNPVPSTRAPSLPSRRGPHSDTPSPRSACFAARAR